MKKLAITLVTLLLCICAISQTPVMTMTTTKNIGSTFSFYLKANAANTPIQVDFGDGTLVNKSISTNNTVISDILVGSQIIKVYGTGIILLDCSNNQLTGVDVSQNTVLTELYCNFNQLTSLDITKNVKLLMLQCSRNKISSLDISKNIALTYIDCSSNLISTLDISMNTALTKLICTSNNLINLNVSNNNVLDGLHCGWNKITKLDVSNNTLLNSIICSGNQLTTLDVTHNIALKTLECYANQLTSLDVAHSTLLTLLSCENNQLSTLVITQNTELTNLDCQYNNLNNLNLNKNTTLKTLNCGSNNLNTLDISANTALTVLDCSNNQLTAIDVTKNIELKTFNCIGNKLTFKTLYLPQPSWTDYQYAYQKPISIHKTLALMTELDLSSQLKVGENITDYVWKTKKGTILVKGIDYNITDGKTIFLKSQNDSVLCQMTNTLLPNVNLVTTYTSLHGPMSITTSQAIGSTLSFYLSANANNTAIKVDFGDGLLVDKSIDTSYTEIDAKLVGSQIVKIYGTGITFLSCSNNQLTALNVSETESLKSLLCYNNKLISLDITKNTALTWLNFYDNPITSLDVTKNTSLMGLICGYTQLSNLDVSKNIALQYLYCDSSRLITLDVSKNTILKELGCGGNKLTLLDLTQNTDLKKLLCNDNMLTFKTLPLTKSTWSTFIYSPQNQISIIKTLKANTELDLSNQLTVNGNTTVYNWKTKSGSTLFQGTDYTLTGGKTIFLKSQTDSVYCEMTNATFPDLTGSSVLKTTYTKVESGTALTNMEVPEVEMYSNQNTLYINIPFNAQVSIFESNGRLVLSKHLTSGSNSFQMQNIGIYLVKLLGNKSQITKKIFIE